jgi:hypothetical protein
LEVGRGGFPRRIKRIWTISRYLEMKEVKEKKERKGTLEEEVSFFFFPLFTTKNGQNLTLTVYFFYIPIYITLLFSTKTM